MKIFGIKLKPLFRRSAYSYTSAAGRHKRKPMIDTKAIFADGVALGRMLALEDDKPKPRKRSKRR
jgi:hypothetical protein